MKLLNTIAFGAGSVVYDLMTGQNVWREHVRLMLEHVDKTRPVRRALDVGCGPGVSTFVLAEALGEAAEVVGIDVSPAMVRRARAHHARHFAHLTSLRFEQADAGALPFEDGAFDLVIGHSFLYLVPDREGVARDVRRVTAPGGQAIFMEPAAGSSLLRAAGEGATAWRRILREPGASARFAASMVGWRMFSAAHGRLSPQSAGALLEGAGFRDVACHRAIAGLGMHCVGQIPLNK